MDNKTLDLSGISDEELLKLLKNIQEHISFLNKSIIVIPSAHLLTCSQHFVLGVEDMAKAVYPELFSWLYSNYIVYSLIYQIIRRGE